MQSEAFWRRCGDVGGDRSTGERLEDWSGEPARIAPGRTPPGHSARSPRRDQPEGAPERTDRKRPCGCSANDMRMIRERYANDTRTARRPGT